MTELKPLTVLRLQAAGDGGWEHWAVPLSPENLKDAQVMRSPVLLICTSRKTQLKPPVLGSELSLPPHSHLQHFSS